MVDVSKYVHWSQSVPKNAFHDYVLILPDISIGNVGQLAVDLLLNNMNVEHLGRIAHPCFIPFIGGNPFDLESRRLESSCEMYVCEEKNFLLLQIRSCVFQCRYSEFKNFLLSFIKTFGFKQTVVLASCASQFFSSEQIQSCSIFYLNSPKSADMEELQQMKWLEFALPNTVMTADLIPGSFISQDLLDDCEEENLSLIVLICVCSEGDNYPEAFHMVNCINMFFRIREDKNAEETWKIPISWKLPYGSAAPPEIY